MRVWAGNRQVRKPRYVHEATQRAVAKCRQIESDLLSRLKLMLSFFKELLLFLRLVQKIDATYNQVALDLRRKRRGREGRASNEAPSL